MRAPAATASSSLHDERQQLTPARPDLNLGPHRRAYAAVVTGGPAAVLDLAPGQGVLPVPPQPLAVETGVEVVPRQDLVLVAFPRGVPVEVDGLVGERLGGALGPAVERE